MSVRYSEDERLRNDSRVIIKISIVNHNHGMSLHAYDWPALGWQEGSSQPGRQHHCALAIFLAICWLYAGTPGLEFSTAGGSFGVDVPQS